MIVGKILGNMKKITLIPLFLISVGCVQTLKPTKPFPAKPNFESLNQKPILGQDVNGNYVVTKEFVTRATQEHEFLKKVLDWKDELIFK